MVIRYVNYLGKKTASKFNANRVFTNISESLKSRRFNYHFTIDPVEDEIYAQAKVFSKYISSESIFANSFLFNSFKGRKAYDILIDVYVYSYVKCVFYSAGRFQVNKPGVMMAPSNNTCFYGHATLFNAIASGLISTYISPNNVISIQIDLKEDVEDIFKDWAIWNDIYEDGRVFNYDYELVLRWFSDKTNVIKTKSISQVDLVPDLSSCPIGNSAYSNDMLQLLYIECNETPSDTDSFYFGIAVLLKAVYAESVDEDDEVYDTANVKDLDPVGLGYTVQSITGWNPFIQPKVMSTDPNIDNGGSGPNPRKPKDDGPITVFGISDKRNLTSIQEVRNTKNTRLSTLKGKVSKFTSNSIQLLKKVDDVLMDDRTEIVAAIISDVTGKKVRPKVLRNYIGERISSVLSRYGVHIVDAIPENQEFDAFYGETDTDGNRYILTLTGAQKQLT
jgi:hypothetical protein